jgi:hypothetical protein
MNTAAHSKPLPTFISRPFVRLILGVLAVILPVVVVQLAVSALPLDRLIKNLLLALLTPPVAIWAYSTFVRLTESRHVEELGPRGALKELGVGTLVGALILLLVVAILASVGAFAIAGSGTMGTVLIPFFIAFAGAPFEELLFRGLLFRITEQGLGSWAALVISAVIFGGLHLLNENATVFGAVAVMLQAGLMLGAAFMATRRLWLPIGIHFAWNFMQSGIFGIAVSGGKAHDGLFKSTLTGPDLLTGGSFGVEGSIVTIALGLALSIYFLWLALRRGNIVPPPWRRPAA